MPVLHEQRGRDRRPGASSSAVIVGVIDLHIGMSKAGSSTIQAWLGRADTRSALRERGITVCFARFDPHGHCTIDAVGEGTVNSGGIIGRYFAADGESASLLLRSFFSELEATVDRLGHVVLSGESFYQPLWRHDQPFLAALDGLGERVDTRLAAYLRPQHGYLEAAWRQWGFRTDMRPSGFVRQRLPQLHYHKVVEDARLALPNVKFRVRPFRVDLLTGSDIVLDFSREILGLDLPGKKVWENRGLALDVVNFLATIPRGVVWADPHDNAALDRLREVLAGIDFPESDRAAESRYVLQAFAHETFEHGNRQLIKAFGWPTDHFVPSPPAGVVGDLGRLNGLWTTAASPAEQLLLRTLLVRVVRADQPT